MLRILALSSLLLVSSCSSVTSTLGSAAVGALTGGSGGPSLDAQVGKTNQRTIGVSGDTTDAQIKGNRGTVNQDNSQSRVNSEKVERVEINEFNPWLIALLILGWLLPSPNEMGRWVANLFKRKK